MSQTSSSMLGKSEEQKPRRTPRWMKAVIRCRLDDANPHQALQACSNLIMMTDLKTACKAVSHKPCAQVVSAY